MLAPPQLLNRVEPGSPTASRLCGMPSSRSPAARGGAVFGTHRFGLRRPALPQEYREHGERPHRQQFGLPVLQAAVPKIGRPQVSDPLDRIFPLAELVAVV